MKKITKRLLAVVIAVLCMASLAACGSSVDVAAVDETTQSYMEQQMDSLLSTLGGMSADELKQYEQVDDTFTVAAVTNFEGVMDELGAYKGLNSTEVEVDDKEYTVTSIAQFEQRTAIVTLTLKMESQSFTPESITFEAVYSLGESLERAGLNTVMGVGIVFIILIFLSCLISLFKYVGKLSGEGKKEEKKASTPAPAAAPVVEKTDDLELVAVIAAAIAAAENTSTDSFVVRSIKKVNKSKWRNA